MAKKKGYIKSRNIYEWYHFIPICIITKFGHCSLGERCDITFLIYHVIKGRVTQWLHTISYFPIKVGLHVLFETLT